MHFPSRYSCLLFVLPTRILLIFAPCICVIPTIHFICCSAFLLSNSLFQCALICLSPSSPTLIYPSPPLVLSSAPWKRLDFLLSAYLKVISYFYVRNYCLIWPPFLLTSGQHFLFVKPFSLMKQYTCFYNLKVVRPHMLCPYQCKGSSSPFFFDVHNAQWRKRIHLKVLQNYYEMGKKCSLGLKGTSNSKCDQK